MIKTQRLLLIPATSETLRAELEDSARLSALLSARVPESWPPESLKDAIPWFLEQVDKNPGQECWYSWYALLAAGGDSSENTLVGSVGFKGAPDEKGMVEIGYSVLEEYQGKGIAGEMALAITEWALSQKKVKIVTAQTMEDNYVSMRVLEKCKFIVKERQGKRVIFQVSRLEGMV